MDLVAEPQPVAKPIWQSKTAWLNVVMAGLAFFPQVQAIVANHSEVYPMVFAAINLVLRFVTKSGVQLWG